MCSLPAVAIGVQVASSLFGYNEQKRQAGKQNQAIERGQQSQEAALTEQSAQVDAQSTDNMSLRAREAMIERGRLAAVAADSGLGGAGAERLANASRFAEGFDTAALEENRKRTQRQIDRQRDAVRANTDARYASVVQPSLIGTGLQIGGSLLGGLSKMPNGGK